MPFLDDVPDALATALSPTYALAGRTPLGHGAFSEILRAVDVVTGAPVAVKRVFGRAPPRRAPGCGGGGGHRDQAAPPAPPASTDPAAVAADLALLAQAGAAAREAAALQELSTTGKGGGGSGRDHHHPAIVRLLAVAPRLDTDDCGGGGAPASAAASAASAAAQRPGALVLEAADADWAVVLRRAGHGALPLPLPLVKAVCWDLLSALASCHARGIAHGDVKPANLLVWAETGRSALADWGLAVRVGGGEARPTDPLGPGRGGGGGCGAGGSAPGAPAGDTAATAGAPPPPGVATRWYRSPEALAGSSAGGPVVADPRAADLWGAGCTLCELLTLTPPASAPTDLGQAAALVDVLGPPGGLAWPWAGGAGSGGGAGPPRPAPPSPGVSALAPDAPPPARALLATLLAWEPAARGTAAAALAHPFFHEPPARATGAEVGAWVRVALGNGHCHRDRERERALV